MVDFNKLRKGRDDRSPIDPRAIFKRQPKPPGINDLWQSQREVLDLWVARQDDRDLVIKLNTGGGKTLVGLLIAQATMARLGRGALYLCADRQLVDQTVAKAVEMQLPAVPYVAGWRSPLPAAFLNGEAILVATYRALFHGMSKFGTVPHPRTNGDPFVQVSTIICDDAHTAFAELRDAFSIRISRAANEALYLELTAQFRIAMEEVGRLGSYDHAVGGHDTGVFELPYWAWRQQLGPVRDRLRRDAANEEFKYQLPLLLDAFEHCHVLVSARAVTITSLLPMVDQVPTFTEAPHRVFMSATIADDSALIRTFGVQPAAVQSPIAPESLAGIGERMILAPALTRLGSQDEADVARTVCERAAKEGVGVVILTPSEARAKRWNGVGRLVLGDQVADAIAGLLNPARIDNGPYVFANRYDGIDLPGDACRVLVIDGLPQGSNDYDVFRATVLRGNSRIDLSLAQRVEQGLGRGTRGAGDYCVVLLLGNTVDWIGRRDSAAMLTSATRTQVELGLEVSRAVESVSELYKTIKQCLKRDPEWVRHHANELADKTVTAATPDEAIAAAVLERDYLKLMRRNQPEQAARIADRGGRAAGQDQHFRGWLLQLAARAYHAAGRDPEARALQTEAYDANGALLRPRGVTSARPLPTMRQAEAIADLVDSYELREVLLRSLHADLLPLSGRVPAADFEQAMHALGRYLGFGSFRHDDGTGAGPDNAWVADGKHVFVLSCKNEKGPRAPLYKKDLGQLMVDAEWVRTNYADVMTTSVLVQSSVIAAQSLPADGIFVLTLDRLGALVSEVQSLYASIAAGPLDHEGVRARVAERLTAAQLTAEGIQSTYLQRFVVEQPKVRRSRI